MRGGYECGADSSGKFSVFLRPFIENSKYHSVFVCSSAMFFPQLTIENVLFRLCGEKRRTSTR